MRARNLPALRDAATARWILLDGLAGDSEVAELAGELAPLHPRNDAFPGEVFLCVAADVLDWCGASRAAPLTLEGIRERWLPECAFRGRPSKKLQGAVLAASALRGGADPFAESACRRARHARNWPSATARGPNDGPGSLAEFDRTGGVRWRGPGCRSGST